MKEIGKIWLEYRQQDTWYFLTWCPVTRYLTSRILTRNYWLDFSCFMFCLLLWWFFHFFSVSILFICCVWECQSTTEAGRESWRYLYPGAGADREVERERERGTIWPRVVSCNLCHLTSLTRGQPCLTRWGIKIITFVRSTKEYFLVCSRISLQSVHCQCSGDRLKIAEYLPEPWCSLTQGGREACVACIKWPQSRVLSERDRCTSNT